LKNDFSAPSKNNFPAIQGPLSVARHFALVRKRLLPLVLWAEIFDQTMDASGSIFGRILKKAYPGASPAPLFHHSPTISSRFNINNDNPSNGSRQA
jgi:hypothetical protein